MTVYGNRDFMKQGTVKKESGLRLGAVVRTSTFIFLFLVAAKLLNFFKKILIGQLFGVSSVADAFFAASFFPYYLAIFFEGVLFLTFLPLFASILAEKGKQEAGQFVSEILLLVFVLTGALAFFGWIGAPWVISQLVPGFDLHQQHLTCELFQILSLVLVFISLTSFFKALNSYFEHYAWAASSALIDTLVMIGVTLMTWKVWGIRGAAWAAVAGAFTALILQAAYFFWKHPDFWEMPVFRGEWLGQFFSLIVPMGMIWGFQQIPLVILNRFGSGMWQGTISALTISQTLTTVPMGLVNHTVLFAIFPMLAKQAHEPSRGNLKDTFFQTLKGGFLILIPIGFFVTSVAPLLASVFFQGGGIAEEGTRRISNSLICFGWAIFALYADLFMTQSLIAIRKTIPAIFLCASRAVLTYVIGYVLSSYWDYQGLALSFSLALVLNFFFLFPLFFQGSPFRGGWKDLFGYAGKLTLASSPVLLLGLFVNHWPVFRWAKFPDPVLILVLGAGFLCAVAVYLFSLFSLRVKEIRLITQELGRKWNWKNWWWMEQSE